MLAESKTCTWARAISMYVFLTLEMCVEISRGALSSQSNLVLAACGARGAARRTCALKHHHLAEKNRCDGRSIALQPLKNTLQMSKRLLSPLSPP